MTLPSVSVIVATSGGSDRLAEVLRRAREQVDSLGAELILVWNAPPADERRSLALAALVHKLVVEPIPGKSRALNSGVGEASGEICAFLDDDGLPEDGRITDNDNASDEYLYNHGDDPAMPGATGAFATVRDDQLRMMRISIIVGVASSVMGGNTVSLLDGPPRTHAGIYLEPSSTRVSMRNVNVFTQ